MGKEGPCSSLQWVMMKNHRVLKLSKGGALGMRRALIYKKLRMVCFVVGIMCSFLLLDSLMLAIAHHISFHNGHLLNNEIVMQDGKSGYHHNVEKSKKLMHERLLTLASTALIKNDLQQDQFAHWKEPYEQASLWKPCAHKSVSAVYRKKHAMNSTGFILVSANGGVNQQRVAVCNAVAIAAMLNATLILPTFLYSSVWKDKSQFSDIYEENHFINYLKDDVRIIKELPSHLQSLNLESIGSKITDLDIKKESKPIYFTNFILPLLLKNGVVHFHGFGNRLSFDPIPADTQKLRCKCNFHALKFAPRIQKIGSLLVKRIRKYDCRVSELDKQLLGKHMPGNFLCGSNLVVKPLKYLALHMRFEMDMVAYSVCDFGGGEKETRELEAYRDIHFPALVMRMKENGSFSPAELRKSGRCPLTPEEAALMLSALGYKQNTYIYLAGSDIYGGRLRMLPFAGLYPNLVTKEDLLTTNELAPFRNFSSQLAALDFIACAAADVFAMTDSGSQLSSLVTGFRTYHGRGHAPTLRPNKKRFAKILSENGTLNWIEFKERVKKMIEENQRVQVRRRGRSIYRQPRCPECMCKVSERRQEHM